MNSISSRIQLERYVSCQKLVQKCRILSGQSPLFTIQCIRSPPQIALYWSVWSLKPRMSEQQWAL